MANLKLVATAGTLAAFLLPSMHRQDVLQDPVAVTRVQGPASTPQDPNKEVATLRDQIATANRLLGNAQVELAALQEERGRLRVTQDAFTRMREFGTPLEREANLRYSVEERLTSQERALAAPATEEELRVYRATVASVFSQVTIDRDSRELDAVLQRLGVSSAQKRATLTTSFVETMGRWAKLLEHPDSIRRLVADTNAPVAASPLPDETKTFLRAPCDLTVTALVVVGREYLHAKSMYLEGVLKEQGILAAPKR